MGKVKKILTLYLVLLFSALNVGQVLAVSTIRIEDSMMREFSQGNMPYYNPVAGCGDGDAQHCIPMDSSQTTWIGDSYSAESEQEIKKSIS